jgi:hypothetical protein
LVTIRLLAVRAFIPWLREGTRGKILLVCDLLTFLFGKFDEAGEVDVARRVTTTGAVAYRWLPPIVGILPQTEVAAWWYTNHGVRVNSRRMVGVGVGRTDGL